MDNRQLQSEKDVQDFFFHYGAGSVTPVMKKMFDKGVIIDTKLRREIMTGTNNNRTIINGTVMEYKYENLGGGVWRCKLGKLID